MKLASLAGGRDGRLVVVSDDLGWCVSAAEIAPTLAMALADWERCEPLLRGVARFLNNGAQRYRRFEPAACLAPLPDADVMAAPCGELEVEGGAVMVRRSVTLLVGPVAPQVDRRQALAAIRLVLLGGRFGEAVRESPTAVTLDALGDSLRDGRLVGAPSLELDGDLITAAPLPLDFAAAILAAAKGGGLAMGGRVTLVEDRANAVTGVRSGAVLRCELRDGLCRSSFGAIEQYARTEALAPALA